MGNQTTAVDPRGAVTSRSYDRLDRLTRVDHPAYTPPGGSLLAPYETFGYDAAGNMTSRRDRRGQTTDFVFDARNRPVRQQDPLVTGASARGETITHYDGTGLQATVIDPTGATVKLTADDLGRARTRAQVVRQPTTATFTTTFDYDDAGNQTYQQDPTGAVTTSAYDQAGQLLSVTDPLGKQTTFSYDAAGRRTSETDPLGRRTEHVFDPAGRETSTVAKQPGTGTVLATDYRGFDEAGNQTAARSARSSSASDSTYLTSFVYDSAGRLVSVTPPGAGTTSYGYDAAGNVTRVTDGNNNVTISTWTPWSTRESTVEPSTPGQTAAADRTFAVTPDAAGLPVSEAQPGVTITRTFDQLGRLTAEAGTGTGVTSASRSFGYDLAGRRTSISHPAGTVTLAYDDRGLLLSASQPGTTTPESAYAWDPAARMTSRTDTAGTTTFTYTTRGELDVATDPITGSTTNFDWNDAGQPATATYATSPTATVRTYTYDGRGRLNSDTLQAGSTVLTATAYSLDAEGNLTSQAVTAAGNPAAGTHTYSYDPSGRLDTWTSPSSVVTDYDYDPAGNRVQAGAHTSVYDARNRLLDDGTETYTWAPRGTLASTTAGGTTTTVAFDGLGRQSAVGTVGYQYDALDRITTRDSVAFHYAGTEIDPATVGGEAYARTPAGDLLAVHAGSASAFAGENRHGDLSWLLAGNGTVTDSRVWDPYGQPAGTTGSTATSLGYQGDYTDPATGDVWMGARWYQPSTATFTARDTVFGMLQTPVTLNRYTYANADPLEYFDPDGRWAMKALKDFGRRLGIKPKNGGASATSTATLATSKTASSAAKEAKKATAERAKAFAAMGEYLVAQNAANPKRWNKLSDTAKLDNFQWAVLANGGKTKLGFDAWASQDMKTKQTAWNKNNKAAFKKIDHDACKASAVDWMCRHQKGITQGLLGVAAVGLAASGVAAVRGVAQACGLTWICAATVAGGALPLGPAASDVADDIASLARAQQQTVSVASGSGAASGPASVVRSVGQTETLDDLFNELKSRTWVTDQEHALVRLKGGECAIVCGGQQGIHGMEIKELIAHTHPYSLPAQGASVADYTALNQLGQQSSVLLEQGRQIVFSQSDPMYIKLFGGP